MKSKILAAKKTALAVALATQAQRAILIKKSNRILINF